ncbi:MAG TPA: class I lanthipeptide [Frankiaceae bacterium]|nr:class I lanthipeptide [Frankiaceae bacterium]
MNAVKKLTLKKETLTDLTTVELHGVVGGAASGTPCDLRDRIESDYTCLIKWPTKEGCTPAMPG